MSKRDEYVSKAKDALDDINAQLAKLEARADSASESLSKKNKELMDKLRAQSESAKGHLQKLQASSEDKWESVVAEYEHVKKALVQSFNYFKSQL